MYFNVNRTISNFLLFLERLGGSFYLISSLPRLRDLLAGPYFAEIPSTISMCIQQPSKKKFYKLME